jgi:L-threonylcarbamoyladenylate synthase
LGSSHRRHRAILAPGRMNVLQRQIEQGIAVLREGGVIAFPTDTVYGLGADAFDPAAVERVYEIKDRAREQQVPLLIADMQQMAALTDAPTDLALFLARRFWPGGLTLVLPTGASVPTHLARAPGIALRIPDHPLCLTLIRGLGRPIVGTSANISGTPPALTAEEVREQLGARIDLIIDGGRCPGGKESTVVDVTHQTPAILREGIIPRNDIDRAYVEYKESHVEAHCHRL